MKMDKFTNRALYIGTFLEYTVGRGMFFSMTSC